MNLMLIQVTNVCPVIINFEQCSEIFDNLENLEPSLFNEIKMALVYFAGYITRNDNQPSECKTHYEKYGKYTNLTDCRLATLAKGYFLFHPFPYNKGKGLL